MRATFALVLLGLVAVSGAQAAEDRPVAEQYLISGDLAGGEKALKAILKNHPDDAQARFGLGTVEFVQAVENLVQGFHKYGLQSDLLGNAIPFARLPIPTNPRPEPITYGDLRRIFETFVADLTTAESTLAEVKDSSVKLPIRFGRVRMDFDGDGKATEGETLMAVYARLNAQVGRNGDNTRNDPEGSPVTFDYGDVAWMRGYCHLLMTFSEVYLAHDGERLFNHTAHLFFPRPKTPFPFLKFDPAALNRFRAAEISDLVAFIHLLRFPLKEPARMESALKHMETMIALSRESWKAYLAETDNDHEWIPNPKQDTVMPGGKVTDEMVKGWTSFLDEAEMILSGKMLVPFWRDADGMGVNLRKVFTDPREMDPILWIQGTAAAPYLEKGPVTKPETWARFMRIFRGEFIGFALWFN
ncbi:MAG: hypothetical protein JWN86_3685 [Planctomycetota bacterium]|nr:hypothetical protein [Planctomycetota bacterium]